VKSLLVGSLIAIVALGAMAQPPRFAVQGHTMQGNPEGHARTIEMLVEAGIGMIRDECHWGLVERTQGEFTLPGNWNANLDINRANGIETLLILNYTNALYDDGLGPHTEEGRAAFTRYCEFMAQETLGRVQYFEIWNEPNAAGFWPPEPNPEDYAALVAMVSQAIRDVNPEAVIIAGSTSGTDEEFFRRAFEAGMHGHCDAISIHPYCTPVSPEGAEIFPRMRAIHEMSGEYGDPLPVWITEFGYPTRGASSVTEDQQANFVARTYLTALVQPWVTSTFYYWFGPDQASDDWNENNFGLVRHDRSHKPSFTALQTITALFASAEFSETLDVADGIEAHVFTIPASGEYTHLTAMWAQEGIRHVVVSTDSDPLLVTRDGDELPMTPWDEQVALDLSGAPISLLTDGTPNLSEPPSQLILPGRDACLVFYERDECEVTVSEYLFALREPWAGDFTDRLGSQGPIDASWSRDLILEPLPSGESSEPIRDECTLITLYSSPLRLLGEKPVARLVSRVHLLDSVELVLTPLLSPLGENRRVQCVFRSLTDQGVAVEVTVTSVSPSAGVTVCPETLSFGELEPHQEVVRELQIVGATDSDTVHRLRVDAEVTVRISDPGTVERLMVVSELEGRSLESEQRLLFHETIQHVDQMAYATSPRLASPPVLDGDLTDWPSWDSIHLGSRDQITGEFEPWGGPEEASARVWTGWDDEWFYLAAEVQDQTLCDAVFGHEVHKNDGLEVYFDTDHDGDRDEARYSDDDNQFCLALSQGEAVAWAYSHLNDVSPGVRLVINRTPSPEQTLTGEACGYIVEAAFPLDEINLRAPHHGMHIGFNVALNDDDDPSAVHPFGQDLQMMWTGLRLVWQNPQTYGDLFLVDPERMSTE
jgi:Carbohydrate family 9 binding domain-like/Cellulase (glycosyl hydrolase family 5)